jgi:hypothetical protein
MSTRSCLYRALRLSNDARAVRRGTIEKRIVRRTLGRATGRWIGRLTR